MPASPVQTYTYRPIALDQFETYIVTLYPGQYNDEILIALDPITIPVTTGLTYEALSYTWGSNNLTHTVRVVSGSRSEGILPITANLDIALRHLRFENDHRILWIDAISIDQNNMEEKSHQVQWMGSVYKHARRVIIFLGTATDKDLLALNALEAIGKSVTISGFSFQTIVNIREPGAPDVLQHDGERVHKLQISRPVTEAIINLFERPWFSRVWIVQEVRLMRDPALSILQCGHREMSWEHFRKGAFCFRELHLAEEICQDLKMTVDSKLLQMSRLLFKATSIPSFFSYGSLQWFGCKDPRDRLYGTLSLTTDEMAYVKVDYTRAAADIFEEVQRHEIKFRGLWLFQYCCLDQHRSWEGASWVPNQLSFPDYIQEMRGIPTFRFNMHHEFIENKGLRLYGGTMATVQRILSIPPLLIAWCPVEGPARMLEWLQVVGSRLCENGSTGTGQDCGEDKELARKLLQLCDSLMSKTYDETNIGKIGFYSRRYIKSMLIDIFSKKRREVLNQSSPELCNFLMYLNRWLKPVLQYASRPAIFTTNTDDIGYGPASTLPGDKVCAIFGCYRAMLLRPTENNVGGEYLVVGPTCIAGGQRSEAVLGQLPGHVFLVYDTPNSRYAFRDIRTGEMICDPRMKRFKLGGISEGFSDSCFATGDIDLSIAELKERGLRIDTFDLF